MEVLERGDIQFWIRPTVQAAEAESYDVGVQSLFAVMSPAGPRGGERHRRVRIGRKRMPRGAADRFWARVERVGSLQRVLGDRVEAAQYTTKTRGARYQPGALPIARGEYAIVRVEDHLRLTYSIDTDADGDADADDRLDDELPHVDPASHMLLWKAKPAARATWTTTGSPELLDHEGAQVVLVGAKDPIDPDAPATGS